MGNSKNNSIDISGSIVDSSVSIVQNQKVNENFKERHEKLEISGLSNSLVDRKDINKSTYILWATLLVSALTVIGSFSSIASFLGVKPGQWLIIPVMISIGVWWFTEYKRSAGNIPNDGNAHLFKGRIAQVNSDRDVEVYDREMKCIYPHCEGIVTVTEAPARELPNVSKVGVCSVGGHEHSYSVDFNWVAVPQKFDWRPIAENVQK